MSNSIASNRRRRSSDLSAEQFDRLLAIAGRFSLVFLAVVAAVSVLKIGQPLLAPVGLAIVVGLVFGPVMDNLEARGISPGLSAGITVLSFLGIIVGSILLFSVPLSEWIGRWPQIWQRLQTEMLNWRESLQALSAVQEQIDEALGANEGMRVQVDGGSEVIGVAMVAPAVLGDILIFLASLYFYLATRDAIRTSILSVIASRKLRWRAAHVFNEVETRVSRFLLSVTFLNVIVGVGVSIIAFAFGMPSPLLWGTIAAVLNYIPYVGQAVMIGILLLVGFATQDDMVMILAPIVCYMGINLVEGQFAFPAFVGRIMTLNPFLIFFSIIFWIWVWGPVGSLMAVPSLIILQSLALSVVPAKQIKPSRPVRRGGAMNDKDVILENAARAIRERREERERQTVLAAATGKSS